MSPRPRHEHRSCYTDQVQRFACRQLQRRCDQRNFTKVAPYCRRFHTVSSYSTSRWRAPPLFLPAARARRTPMAGCNQRRRRRQVATTSMSNLATAAASAAGYTSITGAKFVRRAAETPVAAGPDAAYVGLAPTAPTLTPCGSTATNRSQLAWHGIGQSVLRCSAEAAAFRIRHPFDVMGNIRQMHFNAMQKAG